MIVANGNDTKITRDQIISLVDSGGMPRTALVTATAGDSDHWRAARDEMLKWMSCPDTFELDDQPDQEILVTAIDYAVDVEEAGGPAPSSITPSGSGRIAMEWNDGSRTMVVEFHALGQGICRIFQDGKLVARYQLQRNPRSRKMEIRG